MKQLELFAEDGPLVETTEDEHSHYCSLCGGIWKHSDADCEGERYGFTGYYDCPACLDPQ